MTASSTLRPRPFLLNQPRLSICALLFVLTFLIPTIQADPYIDFILSKNKINVQVYQLPAAEERAVESLLTDQITLSGLTELSSPFADDLAFFVRQHLIQQGHARAEVEWELLPTTVKLTVTAGEPTTLGQIHWPEQLPLPQEELQKQFLSPFHERHPRLKKKPIWVSADAAQGRSLVTNRLRAEGYLLAETTLTEEPDPESASIHVRLAITLGPRFTQGHFELENAPPEISPNLDLLLEHSDDAPFNEASVQQLESLLSSEVRQAGWTFATTESTYLLPPAGGPVDVRFTMQPGARSVIRELQPDATFSKGAQRILHSVFHPLRGRVLSEQLQDLAFRRALDTGVFAQLTDSLHPLPSPPDGPPLADLLLSGEETPTNTLGLELALDTFLGAQIGINYRNHNVFDSGNTFAANLNYSLFGPTGFLSFTDPAFLRSPYAASVRLFGDYFFRYEYSRYSIGLTLELNRRFSRHFVVSAFVDTSVSAVGGILPVELIGPDVYGYVTPGLSFQIDYRDSPTLPRRGWLITGGLRYSYDGIGEAASFYQQDLRGSFLLPISQRWRFALGAAAESISGADFSQIPVDNRVFNGGPTSVRGFAMRELGPVTLGGTPLGGTSAFTASTELSYQIIPNLEGAAFLDAGSLSLQNNTRPFEFSSDLRLTPGLGLRYLLPFGPIRLDYGYNPDRRSGERRGMLHLTAGFAF